MSEEDIKVLEKEVAKRKRIATEWSSQLHDLIEDRLPAAFEEILPLAQSTYEACQSWSEVNKKLKAAQK